MKAIFPQESGPTLPSWLQNDLGVVQAKMRKLSEGRHSFADRMSLEQIASGGKMLRATLALLSAETLRVPKAHALAWATAVELLHNATLVHDDIQDGDTVRRGQPTLWSVHGIPQAINAGDLLLMLPFVALKEIPPSLRGQLAVLLAESASEIVRGQATEMALLHEGRLDKKSYLEAARGKTGGLFALPVLGSLALAGRSPENQRQVADVFNELGVAFQIQDDILDLFGDKGRKTIGCDIYEGKVSALVVCQCELSPESRPELHELLARPRNEKSEFDVERARALFLESGALEASLRDIAAIETKVMNAPCLVSTPGLLWVAEEILGRILQPIAHLLTQHTVAAE